ncbi:DEAD/DEAH box helicase [Bifidobacterium xylocopae]|uniref:DEAD/DEAH box helicase n=1 Tax=Bifidobacterium xylocopae TaxID=2493119 RepID=A0A366KF20_9BIFI|nr:DEAD/DEAH box helicase [Bifidobacterium xylocopae]RBP99271.1 DEAD/DEAH box helicase [Bifidobacterium xylocopae]
MSRHIRTKTVVENAKRRNDESVLKHGRPKALEPGNVSAGPSERYARFRAGQRRAASAAGRFAAGLPFQLDAFQQEAIDALEEGNNVLVAAPTGAGKTIIADFAVHLAQEQNVKAFYTTPIKALSNQKFHDLVDLYGEEKVGLLTGDTSINSEADIVVMTTEVLRNMLYERSTTLGALRYVILDEVHYLADRFRGPVWEEVIIHLPRTVKVVGLSATVSNVEDFSSWIASVRGGTKLVVSERRPVPLERHVILQEDPATEPEVLDLYRSGRDGKQMSRINPQLVARLSQLDSLAMRETHSARPGRRRASHGRRGSDPVRQPNRYTPRRWAVIDELDYMGMLPGIYFIFSRNGCNDAVEQCMDAGLKLTTDDESRRIRRIVDGMVEGQLSHSDLAALGYSQFRFALEQGIAAHHAGVITLFRQVVEHLFELGLVKAVFATETLALGINMPARCVVVEKLEKFDGTGHVPLTPGEFTQLTGRAGRRGIDSIGHAIVVDHKGFKPETMASLSSKRVYPLHSSFKPTFNMAVNLLNSSDYETARNTLAHSFAQWEANESASELEDQIRKLTQAMDGYEQAAHCDYGDITDLALIRSGLSCMQKKGRRSLKRQSFTSESERRSAFDALDRQIRALEETDRNHPCRQCPHLQDHLKWTRRWLRERHELALAKDRYASRTGSVARQFDRICQILKKMGYLRQAEHRVDTTENSGWSNDFRLTQSGQLLRRIYSEQDLVLAQTLLSGALDHLNHQELAAALSSLVYESRRGGPTGAPGRWPGGTDGALATAAADMAGIWKQVDEACDEAGLSAELPELDFGLAGVIHEWADGAGLARILQDSELTAGDFVRNAKRLSDVLTQVSQLGPYLDPQSKDLARRAYQASQSVNRGIVAYTGVD